MPRTIDVRSTPDPMPPTRQEGGLLSPPLHVTVVPDSGASAVNSQKDAPLDGSVQASGVRAHPASNTKDQESLQERIRLRAYALWEERGRIDGRELDDWTRAESEILGRSDRAA